MHAQAFLTGELPGRGTGNRTLPDVRFTTNAEPKVQGYPVMIHLSVTFNIQSMVRLSTFSRPSSQVTIATETAFFFLCLIGLRNP